MLALQNSVRLGIFITKEQRSQALPLNPTLYRALRIIGSEIHVRVCQIKQVLSYNTFMKPHNFRDSISSGNYGLHQPMTALQSESGRHSFATVTSIPACLRDSLARNSRRLSTMSAETAENLVSLLRNDKCEHQNSKTATLKQSLSALQNKIKQAKKSLIPVANGIGEQQSDKQGDKKILTYLKEDIQHEDTTTFQSSLDKLTSTPSQITVGCYPQIKTYYLSNIQTAFQGKNSRALQHLILSLKILRNQYKIQTPTFSRIEKHKVNLGKEKCDQNKKTLLIDIDQTLLHSRQDGTQPYDIALPVQLENGSKGIAYICIRPYAISFLKKMAKHYEIIAFTASHQNYADAVLDEIDPQKEFIKHRLYRRNCIQIYENIYAKDLRIVNRDLSSLVLVDNAPFSYIYQLQNGIPIIPYYGGLDNELIQLQRYLQELVNCADVRELNKKTFKLHKYSHFTEVEDLVRTLYIGNL